MTTFDKIQPVFYRALSIHHPDSISSPMFTAGVACISCGTCDESGWDRYQQERLEAREWSERQPVNGVEQEDFGGPFIIVYTYTADEFYDGEAVIGTDAPVPLVYYPR
jgi:hypothetical protein